MGVNMDDDQLKSADLERIKAETEKFKTEKSKIDKEQKRHKFKLFLQPLFAALILGPMIWFYWEKVAMPSMQAENIRLNLDIQKTRAENKEILERNSAILNSTREVQIKNISALDSLNKLSQMLRHKYDVLQNRYDEIKYQHKKTLDEIKLISNQYKQLSSSVSLTQGERDEYKNKYNLIRQDSIRLEKGIKEFASRIELAGWEEWRMIAAHRFYYFHPNPFIDTTKLFYSLPRNASVTIVIFDSLKAKSVKNFFINDMQEGGEKQIGWDGRDDRGNIIPNGKYICKVKLGPSEWEEIVVVKKGN
jgi:hypothetical protein